MNFEEMKLEMAVNIIKQMTTLKGNIDLIYDMIEDKSNFTSKAYLETDKNYQKLQGLISEYIEINRCVDGGEYLEHDKTYV